MQGQMTCDSSAPLITCVYNGSHPSCLSVCHWLKMPGRKKINTSNHEKSFDSPKCMTEYYITISYSEKGISDFVQLRYTDERSLL